MKKPSFLVDFSLLKQNRDFRMVFIARLVSVLGLGMMTVAVPVQVHLLTGSTLQVGVIMALDGVGMFIGLLLGGVLADRYDRKKLIIFARGTCGLGFAALALNSVLATPSLAALYLLSAWDGFFGALGMTALMACMPVIVGRENVPSAAALSMFTVRMGMVLSPAVGGFIIAAGEVSWNYGLAAFGTLATLIPLFQLPSMKAQYQRDESPLKSLAQGVGFLFNHRLVGSVVALGTLETLATAVRVIFPALALVTFGGTAADAGLMYAAMPLGAMLGALTSGWLQTTQKPGWVMILSTLGTFMCITAIGLASHYLLLLLVLVVYGYLGSVTSIIQYSLVQGHTPNHLLGRVSSLWTAQDVTGDSVGALGMGALGKLLAPVASATVFGLGALGLGTLMAAGFKSLRQAQLFDPSLMPEEDSDDKQPATA
ncbi:enterobactin transporter EntS [Vibrio sp.]|uniref:Multidrug efflux pump Tap n=1 Tax=Vibrio viridaestus TaxID=2487322 RepID=A0A3N9TBV6_9VIBR|nr:enterobactin transporter EntS [Vibrio viridaestus]MDC0611227.1 enterobactin transporter EntS [Vibrio sp.]RQW61490.1 enterobactin transporter EntS [Vibrio viridaestus]